MRNDMTEKFSSDFEKMVLKVPYLVKREEDGFIVECVDLNIVTQGDTIKEARKNIKEAIELHFKSAFELGILDEELEKLGVVKKKSKLEVITRELESTPIKIPVSL
jgi:predicted RNase H-like HicB family nuclease